MDFGFALLSLTLQTRCVLSRHPTFWATIPSFQPAVLTSLITSTIRDPVLLHSIDRTLLSPVSMLLSMLLSSGILASIYHRGRREQLHVPVFFLTVLATAGMWLVQAVPVDVLAFVYFPWVLLIGLFVSGRWEVFVREMAERQRSGVGVTAEVKRD